MIRFGECEGYTGKECEYCGRVRVERYSNGAEICEKCRWCKQLGRFVSEDELYDDDDEYGDWFEQEG